MTRLFQRIAEYMLFPIIRLAQPDTIFKYLIFFKFDLNSFGDDEYGITPLAYALHYNRYDIAKMLIEFGADVNASWNGQTLLESLIRLQNRNAVAFLIKNGVDLHSKAYQKTNLISLAIQSEALQIIWLLNSNGIDVNRPSEDGKTPLHAAAELNHDLYGHATYYLLQMGANPTVKDNQGNTPLLCAAFKRSVSQARQLFDDKRTDVNATNNLKQTPLLIACEQGAIGMVQDLLCHPAKPNPNAIDVYGRTPLSVAFSEQICDELIIAGADINLKNEQGYTPIHMAVRIGKPNTVQFLLDRGADVNTSAHSGLTPLSSAILGYSFVKKEKKQNSDLYIYKKIFKMLLNHPKTDLNAVNFLGSPPLIFALQCDNDFMALDLIEKGANVHQESSFSHNKPIVYAVYTKSLPVIEKLLNAGANPCVNVYNFENKSSEPICSLLQLAQDTFPDAVPAITQAIIAQQKQDSHTQKPNLVQKSAVKIPIQANERQAQHQ